MVKKHTFAQLLLGTSYGYLSGISKELQKTYELTI